MERSDSITKLAVAMCKAQSEMSGAVKDSNNPFFNANYADLSSVVKAIKEPFKNNGLSYVQFPIEENGRIGVETILMHESGEFLTQKFTVQLTKQDAQGAGSAITYCRRYSLQAIAGIPSEDDDGNAASPQKSYQESNANSSQDDNKPWYNDDVFEVDKIAITNAITSGQSTADDVIKQLGETHKLSKKMRELIKEIR